MVEIQGLTVMLLSLRPILIGLLVLILLILVVRFFAHQKRKGSDTEQTESLVQQTVSDEEPVDALPDRKMFDAVVAAAIAEYIGPDVAGLRILSVRRLGEQQPSRGSFIAAISAAIAEYMGPDVAGLRIRSIKRLDGYRPDKGPFTAAISAAIATVMGEDVSKIRILSVKKL